MQLRTQLVSFHGLLKPLFAALSTKDNVAGTKVESTDADVRVSVFLYWTML